MVGEQCTLRFVLQFWRDLPRAVDVGQISDDVIEPFDLTAQEVLLLRLDGSTELVGVFLSNEQGLAAGVGQCDGDVGALKFECDAKAPRAGTDIQEFQVFGDIASGNVQKCRDDVL